MDKLEQLLYALDDGDAENCCWAADALGELKDLRAIAPLIATLPDKNKYVRTAAAAALKAITGQDFGEDAEKWGSWWEKSR